MAEVSNKAPKVVAIIPARFASTRLPGKALIDIGGKPMLLHVIERALAARLVSHVIAATDDERVVRAVEQAGFEARLTSASHRSGTDRIAEVALDLDADVIVNVQADEPIIHPETIDKVVQPLLDDRDLEMATIAEPLERPQDAIDPGVVKVVIDRNGFALYFSRSPIPWPRDEVARLETIESALTSSPRASSLFLKHTGLYAFRRSFLLQFAKLERTPLEETESLEQLRALEHGYRIKVVQVSTTSIGVDTPEDLERVRRRIDEDVASRG
jgi:3-deoxy-manno-octulosonate cytidylyltransferase (CMP-KDO synthetase)